MVGDAAPSGWSNPLPAPYDASQHLQKLSETSYELVVSLPGGGGYKLIQTQGVWGTQYHMLAGGTWKVVTLNRKILILNSLDPPSPGTYKSTVDFQRGKFTAVKQ
jgi:hypothetical protein